MTYQPTVSIVTAAAKNDANAVWDAWGRGPETFSRRLTTDASPTPASTVTHYLSADSSTTVEDVAIIQAMANGDLPPLAAGKTWGVSGVISAAAALAATDGLVLQCYTASGDVAPVDHVNGILLGRGLKFVPDEI